MTPTEEKTIPRESGQRMPADDGGEQERERQELERIWAEPGGFYGWFTRVHHTSIGKRFIITGFVFFLLGGILALLMRIQLARPNSQFLGPDLYNQIFTMHGTTMMFLFAVPIMEAMGVYLVPLMVGARNIAFPRLNAFSYWVYLFGGIMLYVAFLLNIGPDVGWFSYVTLSGPQYSPGKRADFWAQMITFTELSALAVAIEIIATFFKLRAPGMSLNRIPLFVWSMLVTSFMIIFAMPAVMLASTCLIMDRLVSTHFYNPAEGGDALLWQPSLLVLRPSGGLHHLHSGSRYGLLDHRDFLAPQNLRLHTDGYGACLYSLHRFRPLGASYVCHRFAPARQQFLHRREHLDRDSERRANLLLDCHTLVRQAAL